MSSNQVKVIYIIDIDEKKLLSKLPGAPRFLLPTSSVLDPLPSTLHIRNNRLRWLMYVVWVFIKAKRCL